MNLREALPSDIPAMHRIRVAVAENRLSDPGRITAADYAEHLTTLGRGWVAEVDGEIVGFAIGRNTDGNVWALFVDPAHEGRGHGGRLHDAMVAWLSDHRAEPLWLTSAPGTRAERFYLRRGWVPAPPHPVGEVRLQLAIAPRDSF